LNTEIITIGDELLIGQVIDSNSAWMGRELEREGFRVTRKTCVGDNAEDITSAISSAMQRVELALLTGGLGPTKDDLTMRTLCTFFGCGMHFSEEVYADIQRRFSQLGRVMNELTRNQAMVPDACTVLRNMVGTAPGSWFESDGRVLVSMPGVPSEMEWLMSNEVIPRLRQRFTRDLFILHHTISVSGLTESALAIRLAEFESSLPSSVKLAYLPQPGLIRLRLSVHTPSADEAQQTLDEYLAKLEKEVR
jgi:nicotinamide-nucleotide amidase